MQCIFTHTQCQIMLSFSFKAFSNLNTVYVPVAKRTPYHPNEYQEYYFMLNIHVVSQFTFMKFRQTENFHLYALLSGINKNLYLQYPWLLMLFIHFWNGIFLCSWMYLKQKNPYDIIIIFVRNNTLLAAKVRKFVGFFYSWKE